MELMSDDEFAHYLKLAAIYVPLFLERSFLDGFDEENDRHNTLNCLQIVGKTFVEMQRRLGVKPVFKVPANGSKP